MRTITGSSGRDCVLIILFQLYCPKVRQFDVTFSGWVSKFSPSQSSYLKKSKCNINNLIKFLSNLSKISQKTATIIL